MFTKEQINEILAVCEKATEGPWEAEHGEWDCNWECGHKAGDPECHKEICECEHINQYIPADVRPLFTVDCGDFMGLSDDNADFIALARTVLPQLARRVMELEEINESIRNWNACEEHLHKTLLDENANLRATVAAMQDALEEIKARCELRRQDDDAHYENYYEAKKALAAAGYGGEE